MQKHILNLFAASLILAACTPKPAVQPTPTPNPAPAMPTEALIPSVVVALATVTPPPPSATPADRSAPSPTPAANAVIPVASELFTTAPGTRFAITLSGGEAGQQTVLSARYQNGSGQWVAYQSERVTVPAVARPPDLLRGLIEPNCQLDDFDFQALSQALGYPARLPGWLPDGYRPACLAYIPFTNGIRLQYRSGEGEMAPSFSLTEQPGPYPPYELAYFGRINDLPLNMVPHMLKIGSSWGEYTQGMWAVNHLSATEKELLWMQAPNGPARLRWQAGGLWMEISTRADLFNEATLAKIAAGAREEE